MERPYVRVAKVISRVYPNVINAKVISRGPDVINAKVISPRPNVRGVNQTMNCRVANVQGSHKINGNAPQILRNIVRGVHAK